MLRKDTKKPHQTRGNEINMFQKFIVSLAANFCKTDFPRCSFFGLFAALFRSLCVCLICFDYELNFLRR